MNRLQHKVALVTGAARGIGAAIAQAFMAEGASVIVSDLDEPGGRSTTRWLHWPCCWPATSACT